MKIMLVINSYRCTGCRLCELICSAIKDGEFKPKSSRIRIISNSRAGISAPKVCLQCEKPWCQGACAYEAIERNPITGAMIIDEEKCVGCLECIRACPYGMIGFDDMARVAVKCDLCDGDPKCVEVCYPKAIRSIEYKDA